MPCPHYKITIIKRSKNESAISAAAYQSGEKLFSEYDQAQKYYPYKNEVTHKEIMIPPHAPPKYADRNTLWNSAEAQEKQWKSQLARRFVLAIPREIPPEQYTDLIRDYCREFFISKGMIADFAIHDKGDGNPPEERYEERQKQSKPLLEAFFEWLHTLEDSVDRSSKIGEAILYSLNQEQYLEDGHLSIDNLAAERALKIFAIGRRNWLFCKSIRGAQASATVYSITETALLNGPKPYNYLTYVLEEMKNLGAFPAKEKMRELLPWSTRLPDDCRSKHKK